MRGQGRRSRCAASAACSAGPERTQALLLLEALDRAVVAGSRGGGERSAAAAEDGAGENEMARADGDAGALPLAVDLGCGNGLLTAYLAAALPGMRVLGCDDDADAVASTRATLAASGLDREGVEVTWDVSLSRCEEAGADLVLLNPPFHDGTVIDATLVQELLDAAARVLRPRGQLWFVHNSNCPPGRGRGSSVVSAPATAASRC